MGLGKVNIKISYDNLITKGSILSYVEISETIVSYNHQLYTLTDAVSLIPENIDGYGNRYFVVKNHSKNIAAYIGSVNDLSSTIKLLPGECAVYKLYGQKYGFTLDAGLTALIEFFDIGVSA